MPAVFRVTLFNDALMRVLSVRGWGSYFLETRNFAV